LKLPYTQLAHHLERGLAGLYLVAADEPLLVAEATDEIRRSALERGFDERKVLFVERGFAWESVASEGSSLSLFSSRRILELRMNSPRPGDAGARALRALAEDADPDRLVIVSIQDRLDAAAQKSVWVKTIERHGVVVDIRPVTRADLPRFIATRGRRRGLSIDSDAAEMLADRVEGNLLAADQELTKLALICDDGRVDADAILAAVAMSARYDVFRLSDAILARDPERAVRVLDGLRAEGIAPTLVLWAVVREIQLLARLRLAEAGGQSVDALMSRLRVWQSRQPAVRRALGALSVADVRRLLAAAVRADRVVKGLERAPPWETITDLVLELLVPARPHRAA